MVYPIQLPDGSYKFNNSDIVARYMHAADLMETEYAAKILNRIFTETNPDGIMYQSVIMQSTQEEAEGILQNWLKEFGMKAKDTTKLIELAHSDAVDQIMAEVKNMVENQIHAKGIPTMLYDGKKHNGLYKAK